MITPWSSRIRTIRSLKIIFRIWLEKCNGIYGKKRDWRNWFQQFKLCRFDRFSICFLSSFVPFGTLWICHLRIGSYKSQNCLSHELWTWAFKSLWPIDYGFEWHHIVVTAMRPNFSLSNLFRTYETCVLNSYSQIILFLINRIESLITRPNRFFIETPDAEIIRRFNISSLRAH